MSPDSHSVAILCKDFSVLVHDKIREKTFAIEAISINMFEQNAVSLESLLNEHVTTRGEQIGDRYSIYVSNGLTNIFVIASSERLVATWSRKLNHPNLKDK